jgi:hypothetical protein
MIKKYIELLKTKIDGAPVKIHFLDGETVIAKILSVSEREKDVIYRVASTNNELPSKTIRATFEEIDSVMQ